MTMLGCKPEGRLTEQHDMFFGIANTIKDLAQAITDFWPEAKGNIHLDAYREVNFVDGFKIEIANRLANYQKQSLQLYFLNLGGYNNGVFDEAHYKMLIVAPNKASAITQAKSSLFFKEHFSAHVDDKYGVDVDDAFDIEEVLSKQDRDQFYLKITPTESSNTDELVLGYMPIHKL